MKKGFAAGLRLVAGAVLGPWLAAAAAEVPFGVCSHLADRTAPWGEASCRNEVLRLARAAGFKSIRFDLRWWCQKEPGAPYDFALIDSIVASAQREGIDLLPILDGEPRWARPVKDHLCEFADFVHAVVQRYGAVFPAYEIFNEPNLAPESDLGNPTNYFAVLKTAYETIKAERPEARVGFGGVSHVSESYVRGVFALGGAKYCDFVCSHPYTLPDVPEGSIDAQIRRLREILKEYGASEKPVWASEVGYPSHRVGVGTVGTQVLRAGLRLARPNQKAWRAAYVPVGDENGAAAAAVVEELLDILPPHSTAVAVSADGLKRLVGADALDLVVLPVGGECYLAPAQADVAAFVRRGGVVSVSGGCPLYYAMKATAHGSAVRDPARNTDRDRRALHIAYSAWWLDGGLPQRARTFAAPEALAAGFKADPAGYVATRFLTEDNIENGDEMVPILSGKTPTGQRVVAAAVYRLKSDAKGAVIVSTFVVERGYDELQQARCLVRAAALARAAGAERFYAYELLAGEADPNYSEDHFGIVHANFAPKPAYGAYVTLAREWPGGSGSVPSAWRGETGRDFCIQWTRPDGTPGGMLWSLGKPRRLEFSFSSPRVTFRNMSGLSVSFPQVGERTFLVKIGADPVYFTGGHVDAK